MDLNAPWIAGLAGLLCGVLSGFGIRGGSLLMVWMTAAAALDQKAAQAINLLYFFPTSLGALIFHIRNKMICWRAVLPGSVITVSAFFAFDLISVFFSFVLHRQP